MNEYFSHDYRARTDKALVRLAMVHGMAGIGVYWCIIEMLYEENGYILQSEYERISYELRVPIKLIKSVIEDFSLFCSRGDKFYSKTVLRRLKHRLEKSEKARQSVLTRWEKQKTKNVENTNVLQQQNALTTIKEEKRKKKNKEKENNFPPISPEETQIIDSSKILEKEKNCAKKEKEFTAPSLDEITSYCKARKNNIDPNKFYNHYTALGWRIGKTSIVDWQALVHTWETTQIKTKTKTKNYGNN